MLAIRCFTRFTSAGITTVALLLALHAGSNAASPSPAGGSASVVERAPAPLSLAAEKRAVLAVREDGIERVRALQLRIRTAPDERARRDLEREVQSIKFETRLAELRVMGDFADRRGDPAAARIVAEQIDRLLHPRLSVTPPRSSRSVVRNGGRP